MDFHEDLRIDPDALDQEWLNQPGLYMKWAELYYEARKESDAAKHRYEVIQSQVSKKVRRSPKKYGIGDGRVTEAVVNELVCLDADVQTAKKKMLAAYADCDLLGKALVAFEQRRKTLENLVHLHSMSYFSEPRSKVYSKKEASGVVTKQRVRSRLKKKRKGE